MTNCPCISHSLYPSFDLVVHNKFIYIIIPNYHVVDIFLKSLRAYLTIKKISHFDRKSIPLTGNYFLWQEIISFESNLFLWQELIPLTVNYFLWQEIISFDRKVISLDKKQIISTETWNPFSSFLLLVYVLRKTWLLPINSLEIQGFRGN